jgi:hypothetical protein
MAEKKARERTDVATTMHRVMSETVAESEREPIVLEWKESQHVVVVDSGATKPARARKPAR